MNTELHSKPRILVCEKNKSGLFYHNEEKEIQYIPDADEFSKAVKTWKVKNGVKSLRKYAAKGSDLSTFYKNEHIGRYLSRREIEVDQWGIPIVTKYEASLYTGLSEFSASASYLETEHGGQIISYRCSQADEASAEKEEAFAEAKNVSNLHPIDRFLLSGPKPMISRHILELNSTFFSDLKINNQSLYKGVHYLPFSTIGERYMSESRTLSEIRELIASGMLDGNNSQYFFIQKFIKELELGKIIKFDPCEYNVLLHQYGATGHAIVLAYIIDTKDPLKAKVTKLIGFNSWIGEGLNDPLSSMENNINKFRHPSDPLKIIKIYYGAQIDGKDLLNIDWNCGPYTHNTINALAKLLINKESLYHKRLVEGIEPTLKEKIDAGIKILLINMIIYTLYLLSIFIFEVCIKHLNPSTRFFTSLLLTTITGYYFNLFDFSKGINDPLTAELQRALPQYFDAENGQTYVKDFEERKIVHIKDRWLTGNIPIEGFMVGKIKKYSESLISIEKSLK